MTAAGPGAIDAVGVVIPAHDEAELLPGCLAALDAALAQLPPAMPRLAVVVLDACSDASPRIAARWCDDAPGWACQQVGFRNVGQARAAGMQQVLDAFAGVDPARLWLATSDADSAVPPGWLAEQLALATGGAEAVAGTVEVADWYGYPPGFGERFGRFYAAHGTDARHGHVHGANLGVRGDAYLAVGGFAPRPTGEDHALWNALGAAARTQVSSRRIPVTTSARRTARAPTGFSGFLTALLHAA